MTIIDGGNAYSTYPEPVAPTGIGGGVTMMGRRQAEALMDSTCVITRPHVGEPTIDPETGQESTPAGVVVYTGKCRLRMSDARANGVALAGQQVAEQSPSLSLPVLADGSADVRTNDIAVVTSPLDPTSRTVRIAGMHSQTHATARRFPVEVTT